MRFEADELTLLGGIRHGRTIGSPIAVEIANTEWPKWEQEMSPDPGVTEKPLHKPRPGHADLAGMQKYGFSDARDVLERASARETAARVAAGAVAKALLAEVGIEIVSHVVQMGPVATKSELRPAPGDLAVVDQSEVRCFDPEAAEAMIAEIKAAAKVGDSLGGVAEVIAYGAPVGLGSHVHWDRKLDALLAQALVSIQAVKGVEIGDAIEVAGRRGSLAHDPIGWDPVKSAYVRESNWSGGIEGGMSNGEPIVARVAMKPLATLNRPVLKTVDVVTKEETVSFKERTDVTAVPAMGVVAETMTALVLAGELVRKFGGDSVDELRSNHASYLEALAIRDAPRWRAGPRRAVNEPQRVLLIGMMGAGKSTSGHLLAGRLGWPYLDSDDEIERRTGHTVPEIWTTRGEAAFREEETRVLMDACGSEGPVVVSVAGGAVLDAGNRRLIRTAGLVVWLRAEVATLVERVGTGEGRPLLTEGPAAAMRRLWEERAPLYSELAELTLDVDRLSPPQVVDQIVDALHAAGSQEVPNDA